MAFFSSSKTLASRLTSRLAPGAVATAGLAWTSEQWTSRASNQVVTTASRQVMTTVASRSGHAPSKPTMVSSATTRTQRPLSLSSKSSPSFVEWYEGHLQARPIPTKMVTGSILWSLGDAVAQIVPSAAAGTLDMSTFTYDWMRTGRAFLFGFALHAPTSHVHFNFLEWMTVRAGVTGMGIPVFKAFMEQFVYWSWISNSMYHAAMGYMQGQNTDQVVQRIKDVLWETQKAQWVFWIPVQLLNFQFVPVRHQLNVVLLTSVVWTALLSAWYPPEPVATVEASPDQKEKAQIKRQMSLMTQQSGGGPAEDLPK